MIGIYQQTMMDYSYLVQKILKIKYTLLYKKGDIYNIFSNIDYIEKSKEEYILIAPSYMICNIDYKKALSYHKKSNNDITIIYKNISNADEDFLGTSY